MPFLTQSRSCLTSELPLLILFPFYPILRVELYQCPKCMNYLSRFMTFWTMLCLNELGIQLIFQHMFNSAFRQCHEVWASQFPFLHGLKNVVPPSEACLYGHINWSLTQAKQQSSIGLSQAFPFKRGGKARSQTGFHFTVQKKSVPESSVASLAKGPHLESGLRLIQMARSLLVVVSMPLLLILGRRGNHRSQQF